MTDDERPVADENGRTTDADDGPSTQHMTDTDDASETGEPTATAGPAAAAEPTETSESTESTESTAAAEATDGDPDRSDDGGLGRLPTDRLRGILDRVGLAALVLLALIAGWGFYSQAGAAIRTWLDPAYQPIALAAFNLAILLVALAGVAHQLSRIRANE